MSNGLPKGWAATTLGDIAALNPCLPKSKYPTSFKVSFLGMKAVDAETGRFDASETRTYESVRKGYTSFVDNDVLFAKITPCMENGKVAVVTGLTNGIGFGSTEFHIVRPFLNDFPRSLIFYFLVREQFRKDARLHMTGSAGQLRVPITFLGEHPFPLPPLAEQKRIVTKIEELFSDLDAGVEALKKAQTQLKRYRQSVLKAAFDGKLTQEWRKKNKDKLEPASVLLERIREERKKTLGKKYKEPAPIDTTGLSQLPKGWTGATVGDVSAISSGIGFPEEYQGNSSGDFPFLKVRDISNTVLGGKYVVQEADHYVSRAVCDKLKGKPFETGTVVFAKIGEAIRLNRRVLLGVPALVDNNVMGAKARSSVLSDLFLFHFLSTVKLGDYSQATTVPSVRKGDVEAIPFPLPPLAEQCRIVEEIESRFSIADKAEEIISQSLKQAGRLRQSILKRAFEGKLVPQDPKDEPAEKLLERIKAEKAKMEAEEKTSPRRKRTVEK